MNTDRRCVNCQQGSTEAELYFCGKKCALEWVLSSPDALGEKIAVVFREKGRQLAIAREDAAIRAIGKST